jgi:HAE1 family hydrophobic/amphiphilic exporter-1
VCLITVFIFLYGFGRSLNIISLAGLAFCSGMIVDNAIVVTENIYRHLSEGSRPMTAAREAASEVWGAILISTLTTLIVFVPVIFIQEEAGQLFKDIAIAICLAIALSLTAALTLIPMLASRLCREMPPHGERHGGVLGVSRAVVDALTLGWLGRLGVSLYGWTMGHMIGRSTGRILLKLAVVGAVVLVFLGSLRLLPSAEYLPTGNRNMVLVFASPLVGSNLDKRVESIAPLEGALKADERVEHFFTVFSQRFNAVGIIVKPEHAGERQMKAFVGEMFGRCQNLPGFESLFPTQMSIFRDPGKQIEIDIVGPSLDKLYSVSKTIEGQLYQTEGVQFVRSSFQEGSPEIRVELDRRRCAALQLRVSEAADFVESLVAGKYVGLFNEAGDQIDLTLYAQAEEVSSRRDLAAVQLVTPTGQSVRLDSVADVQTTTGPTAINHVEKERAITLTVNLTDAVPLERAIGAIEREILSPLRQVLPKSYSLRLGGTADKLNSTLRALTGSFYLAVVIVYLLMVALFRSWVYPLIIMVTIPMAMTGAFLGIAFAHGVSGGLVTFDVIAMLGLIILAGIVVNNAILIVHQTLNLRERGLLPDEALREAARSRLRPICMSVGTSVLAMLPLALGRGAGTELYRGLGAVMIGGLVVSTIFTLFLVPALFSLAQDIQAVLGRRHGDS